MTLRLRCASLVLGLALMPAGLAGAQVQTSYTDYRKQAVTLPLGDLSFVDRVVSQVPGTKKPKATEAKPENALGPPDYRKSGDGRAFSLGCHGQATFEFIDNALVDGPGIDLYVFEVGADVEPTSIALSKDGGSWTAIGEIDGGRTSIDLADYGLAGQDFRFVRVTDTGKFCSGGWPGADIDAIAAVGSAIRLRLASSVLFDFDKSDLKTGGQAALQDLIARLDTLSVTAITVVGHTDSKGSEDYNRELSDDRAATVAEFIRTERSRLAGLIKSVGRGETEPVADNSTDDGRAANRRVEVIVIRQ